MPSQDSSQTSQPPEGLAAVAGGSGWLVTLGKVAGVVVLVSGAGLAWMQLYTSYKQHEKELSVQREKESHAYEAQLKSQEQAAKATLQAAEMQLKLKQLEFDLQERAELRKERREDETAKRVAQKDAENAENVRIEQINNNISDYFKGDAKAAAWLALHIDDLKKRQLQIISQAAVSTLQTTKSLDVAVASLNILQAAHDALGTNDWRLMKIVADQAYDQIRQAGEEFSNRTRDAAVYSEKGLVPDIEVKSLLAGMNIWLLGCGGEFKGDLVGVALIPISDLERQPAEQRKRKADFGILQELAYRIRLQRFILYAACSAMPSGVPSK